MNTILSLLPRRVRRPTVRLLLTVALLSLVAQVQAFQLQTMEGTRVNLNDYVGDGRWTLIMFWSTDCIPCEQQKPMIEAFHRDHEARDAKVIGVVLDGLEAQSEIQQIIDRHNTSFPNLVVFTDVFHRQFRELSDRDFRATPTYLLYDPSGTLVGDRTGVINREMLEAVIAGGS